VPLGILDNRNEPYSVTEYTNEYRRAHDELLKPFKQANEYKPSDSDLRLQDEITHK
jgi:hypothetical protein